MTEPDDVPETVAARPEGVPLPEHVVIRSRFGVLWASAVGFAVVLLVLLIFILENGQRADVAFFGVHGHLPLGVALLLAAVFGILLVVVPGIGRMAQLRLAARRHRRMDAGELAAPPERVTPDSTDAGPESIP